MLLVLNIFIDSGTKAPDMYTYQMLLSVSSELKLLCVKVMADTRGLDHASIELECCTLMAGWGCWYTSLTFSLISLPKENPTLTHFLQKVGTSNSFVTVMRDSFHGACQQCDQERKRQPNGQQTNMPTLPKEHGRHGNPLPSISSSPESKTFRATYNQFVQCIKTQ